MTIDDVSKDFERISDLQNKRSQLRMELYAGEGSDVDTLSVDSTEMQITEIDEQLQALGVRTILLSDYFGKTQTKSVEIPESNNETWSLKTYSSVYQLGVRYEVSILTAESSNTQSTLYASDSKSIYAAPGIAAGSADYLRIFGTAASGIVGTVFGTIYDAVTTTISNMSASTVIQNVSATYNWQCDTLMHYVYVKVWDSNADPELCYVYNEVNALVLGITTNVKFNSTDHDKLNYVTYEKRSNKIMSENADNIANALDCFLNYYQVMHSFVSYITITGVGNKSIAKKPVCQVVYPGQLY